MNKLLTSVRGDRDNVQHRVALAGNGKVYNGTDAYDIVQGWNEFEYTQPFSFFVALNRTATASARIFDTRYNNVADRGLALVADASSVGLLLRNDIATNNNIFAFSTFGLKNGRNLAIITYNGNGLNTGAEVYVNKHWARGSKISRSGTLSGSIINGNAKGLIATAAFPLLPPFDLYTGLIKKLQLINRVLTPVEIEDIFNFGTMEAIIPDANFLLDVDFSTDDLTTRPSTPTYTIQPFGAESYASFY